MIASLRSAPRSSVAIYLVLVVICAALWPSLLAFDSYWGGINDRSYAYLIVAISVVWLTTLRRELDKLECKPQPLALPFCFLATMLWLVAWRGNSDLIHQIAFLFVALTAIWTMAGLEAARCVAPAIGYLIYALPIWDQIVPLLQRLTIIAAQSSMGLIDVTVSVNGSLITIPEGTFTIQEGCSGKRYLMVTLAVATIAGVLNRLSFKRQVILLLSSAVLAVLANWLRVFIVIYAGHVTSMQHYFVAVEHLSLGYFIFAILLIAVSTLAFRAGSQRRSIASGQSADHVAGSKREIALPNPCTAIVGSIGGTEKRVANTRWLTLLVMSLLLVGVGVVFLAVRNDSTASPSLGELPVTANRWQGPLPGASEWRPHFVGMADEQQARYSTTGGDVYVYRNIYGTQRPSTEVIYFENTLFAPGEWQRPSTNGLLTAIAVTLGMAPEAYEAISPQGHKWVMMHVYTVGEWRFRGQVLVQAAYGLRAMARPVPAGVIAIASMCLADCESAQKSVGEFWNEYREAMLATMPDKLFGHQ